MNRFLKPKLEKFALLFIGFVLLTAIFLWSERITGQTAEPAPFDSMTYPLADSVPALPDSAAAVIDYRKIENKAFGYGEKLVFSVNYGFINAGSAWLEIDTIIDVRGHDCFRIVSRANSNSFFSKFFKVDDRVATYVDTEGIYPLYFEKHLREGKFKTDRWVRFDQKSRLAIESKGDTTVIPPFVQDVLSAMFYVRTLSLEVGKSVYIDNYADRKNYPLEVRVLKKERKKVDAGEFDCFVVEPLLQEGSGIFANRGKLTVWLSDDQYRLPVFMRSKVIFIGSISAELKSYKLGKIGVLSASSGN
jgi:hypothetical protein